jgi:hypothetical protein
MIICKINIIFLSNMLFAQLLFGQTTSLISVGTNGRLVYTTDINGNKIPDFSGVGYMNGEVAIPTIAVVKIVNPINGDNRSNIQNAINEVAAMPLDVNGFRGAILFTAGTYNISDSININASGIILRGVGSNGSGTNFIATKTAQHTLINFVGNAGTSISNSTKKAITDAYVPIGSKQITVATGHTFIAGDKVFVHRIPNAAWISLLGMNLLTNFDPTATNWTASAYDVYYERVVTLVNGNTIYLDAPIMDVIDNIYATGELVKYTSARIEKCGIENMRISSVYASATDENHGWEAVGFKNIINSWAKKLEVYYFGLSAVHIFDGAAWITVDSCKMSDAKSLLDGGRRYSFYLDGQRSLIKNCTTKNGRHDFVNGSRTCGPNVFYNCSATIQNSDIGPHHRWSTGILFDNIVGTGEMNVQNRLTSGSGHGWSGAQIMFWNCNMAKIVIQDPQGDARNWAIGCIATTITNVGFMTTEPIGIVQSQGTKITAIPSLFLAQLNDRLTAALPAEMINFEAKKNQQSVILSWSTISEINNADFQIQHATNGQDFKMIGQVKGNGTSNQIHTYQFEHKLPSIGINYYRIKQMDVDGTIKFSVIKPIVFSKSKIAIKTNVIANNITVVSSEIAPTMLNFFNATGQLILSTKILGEERIDISKFPSGLFLIRTTDGLVIRFIKK